MEINFTLSRVRKITRKGLGALFFKIAEELEKELSLIHVGAQEARVLCAMLDDIKHQRGKFKSPLVLNIDILGQRPCKIEIFVWAKDGVMTAVVSGGQGGEVEFPETINDIVPAIVAEVVTRVKNINNKPNETEGEDVCL